MFIFAVIADSHIRLPSGDAEGGYPSNRHVAGRNRYVVESVNRLKPAFVIHLGDIVHPIPALPSHEAAVVLARQIYDGLDADLYLIPGNHDIGDKHNAWMPAPVVDAGSHVIYEKHWGKTYQSFDHQDCHFVLLDTPVLNSGLPREQEQAAWLENDLARNQEAGRRLFVFTHYPAFLYRPGEPKHYDNIEEPARSWLLDLLRVYGAEAVFSGHVHNFFFNRLDGTDHYILPSTAFVRPEYAEFAGVAPGDEFGRDDGGKLGFFMVRVEDAGHAIDPVRTYGFSADQEQPNKPRQVSGTGSRLGVSLRHSWAEPMELPTDGLDEFTRKQARNDYVIQALWELGITDIRVPIDDLASVNGRARMGDLFAKGHRFTVFSIDLPDEKTIELIDQYSPMVAAWEVIAPQDRLAAIIERLAELRTHLSVPVFLSPVVSLESPTEEESAGLTFQHFASHGFSARDDGLLQQALESGLAKSVDGVTFRVSPFKRPWQALSAIAAQAGASGLNVMVNLQLPRRNEGVPADDDVFLANHIAETVMAALAFPRTKIFLDTFVDHDRGYYPRHALIDRRYNPRPAFHALRNLEALLPQNLKEAPEVQSLESADGVNGFTITARTFHGILHRVESGDAIAPLILDVADCSEGDLASARYIDLSSGAALAFTVEQNPDGNVAIRPAETDQLGPRLFILSE